MSTTKFKRTLQCIKRFSPAMGADGPFGTINIKAGKDSAEEALFKYESTGAALSTNDPEGLKDLLRRKRCMDWMITSWKELLLEIASDHGISFMERTAILPCSGISRNTLINYYRLFAEVKRNPIYAI